MSSASLDHRRSTVSLFSGAGGLDLGLDEVGWEVLCQVDVDPDCVGTLAAQAARHPKPPLVKAARIEDVDPAGLRQELGLRRGQLTLLAGGPPCQPFTTSGRRRSITDPRASSLFPAYFRFVDECLPTAVLVENVDGMLSAALRHRPLSARGKGHKALAPDEQKGSFLRWFVDQLVTRGYSVSWGVLEAADHGVAQMRQRAIVLGVLGSEPCYLPQPEFGRAGLPPYRTLAEALTGVDEASPVQPLSDRKTAVYRLVPPGGNWRDLPEPLREATMGAAFVAEGGKSGWWRRLAWSAPAPTILGMPDHSSTALIHPDEVRCLSVAECAALQSFPRGTAFAGSPRSQYRQIGNAVPPELAAAIGRTLLGFIERGDRPPPPVRPPWLRASANRRIGTHGWAVKGQDGGTRYHLHVTVRPDHIWAGDPEVTLSQPRERARRGRVRRLVPAGHR